MSRPLISCIVPCYNAERYVAEAVNSIFAQTYRPIEVVIIDDGSTDGSVGVLGDFADRIRLFTQPNGGVAAARNRGIAEKRGEFVAFLDADDLWHAQKLELQMAVFDAHPDTDVCAGYMQNFWIPEIAEERLRYEGWEMVKPQSCRLMSACLFRGATLERVGPFKTEFRAAADREWQIRAWEQKIVYRGIEDIILYRRIHETNLTRRMGEVDRMDMLNIVKATMTRRKETVAGDQPLPAEGQSPDRA